MRAAIYVPPTRPTAIDKAIAALSRAAVLGALGVSARAARVDAIVGDDKAARQILNRSAAPLGTTTDAGFTAELGQNLVAQYVATLAPLSAAAAIMQQGMQVNLGRAASMTIPAREGQPSATVPWVREGNPIPVREYALNDDCQLSPRKFGLIVGLSREAAKRSGGEAVARQLIREDAAATLDGAYFSAAAGDTETHAGMLAGVGAITGYAGADRLAMETDLLALTEVVAPAGSGQIVFVVSPKRAASIRIKAPDLSRELLFLPSLAVSDTDVIAVDPLSWAHGFGDDIDIEVSSGAVVHMETDPAPIVTGGTPASPTRSFWQTDALAYRMIADLAFAPRRPNAVAWATGVTW